MVDWPGLLSWSTKYHDGTAPSEFKQMSDEDRKFLQNAMEEAFGQIEDPNQVMAEAIGQLKAPDRTEESITTALEVIDRVCDDPDCARNCEKLDGLQPLLDLLDSHKGVIGIRTLEILALLFSNNPNIQEAGNRRGAMEIFLKLLGESKPGSDDRSKAFRALVSLVRNMQPLEEKLMNEKDGIKVIISCCDQSDLRLCEKAASFVRSAAHAGRLSAQDVAALAVALTPLLRDIANGQIQYRETLASCLVELAKISPTSFTMGLTSAAEDRLKQLSASKQEDDATELASLQELLPLLSGK